MRKTSTEILRWVNEHRFYKYWYGGKRQKATRALAKELANENPAVWTNAYMLKAIKDVDAKAEVCDCSGFVCGAYDIPDIGTYHFPGKFKKCTGVIKPGMIAWRKGHCGIILDDEMHVAEMRSIDYDFSDCRKFSAAGFTDVFYSEEVVYDAPGIKQDRRIGWYYDDGKGWWFSPNGVTGDYLKTCWALINDRLFFFKADGYAATGFFTVDGKTYIATNDGIYYTCPDLSVRLVNESVADLTGIKFTKYRTERRRD